MEPRSTPKKKIFFSLFWVQEVGNTAYTANPLGSHPG